METLTVSTLEMGRICGLSEVHLGRLSKAGTIPEPVSRGKWSVERTVQAYVAYLKAGGENAEQKREELRLTTAKREKTEAALDEQRMRTARLRNQLLPRDEVLAGITAAFARVRAKLLAIPTKLAPRVLGLTSAAEIEATIRAAVHECLDELASTIVVGIGPDEIKRASEAEEEN
ncbi:hypothetical protein NGM99_12635 [Mesorhizobium sp. RP14(2022)]|uniref:DNA packaging protein n=1 Tax=Mesorhizobium liriopis TaxID=2953882 RepID=A0ABT1C8W5_9HYPH|nr:hypothetical protein [Mesorhizobium liriopis]MCO6050630.1 hypothetical protein [Mesorhizobium liriopis]